MPPAVVDGSSFWSYKTCVRSVPSEPAVASTLDNRAFADRTSAKTNKIHAGASALVHSGAGRELHRCRPLANTTASTQARIDSLGALPVEEVRRIAKDLRFLSLSLSLFGEA